MGGAEIVRHNRVVDTRATRGRHLGRRHRAGHRARRARRQRRWPLGARSRPIGRPGAADPRDGTPVLHHRGPAGARRASRSSCTCIDFEAEIYMRQERGGMLLGTYERAGVPWSPHTTPWDFGQDLLPNDLDRHRAESRRRVRAFPAARKRRHQEDRQRPVHFRARWQSAGRPDSGAAQLLGCLRRHGGVQPGRGRRPGAVRTGWSKAIRARTSGRWTSPATVTGPRGRTPTRRCARTIRGASASDFRMRNWSGRAAAAHDADLRKACRRECGVRRLLRARACAMVRAARARRRMKTPRSVARTPMRAVGEECRAVRESVRSDRDLELRQVRSHGGRRRGMAGVGSWLVACRPSGASRCRRC